jgi:hypothetical protein
MKSLFLLFLQMLPLFLPNPDYPYEVEPMRQPVP